jgi:hypothetical protein
VYWQLLSGEFFDYTFFVPGAVTVWTSPLGPVRSFNKIVEA